MKTSVEVAELLLPYPEQVHGLVDAARALLFKLLPHVVETVDVPAKLLAYGYGPRYSDSICTIILSQKGIKLGFYKGASLPDPAGLLAGSGKVHRHVVITDVAAVQAPALTQLVLDGYGAYLGRK